MKTTITHMGVTLQLNEWAKRAGITRVALSLRLRNGWSIEEALEGAVLLPEDMEVQENAPAWPPRAIVVQGEVVDVPKMRTKVKELFGLEALKEAIKRDKDNGVKLG